MNAEPQTVRIFINSFKKAIFQAESDWLNLTDVTQPGNSKFLLSFEAFFAELNSAYSSVFFRTIPRRYSLPVI